MTLYEVKSELWNVASKKPLFDVLQSKNRYIFCGLNRETTSEEEFYDQTRRIRELVLLLPILRVIEVTNDDELLELNAHNAIIARYM